MASISVSCPENCWQPITRPGACPYSLNLAARTPPPPLSPPPSWHYYGGELAAMMHSPLLSQPCRWLVGVSYRVIYRKDSIPACMSVRSAFLKHVHGAVYIRDGEMQAGEGPASAKLHTTIADHAFRRYAEAVYAVCLRHLERDHALGGEHWPH